MKIKSISLIFVSFFLFSHSAFSNQSVEITDYIKVSKVDSSSKVQRFLFELCEADSGCEVLGQPHGYSADSITSLSGGWQRRVGAPALAIVEGAGGLVAAFFAGWALAPAATATAVNATLVGGAVSGATAPSIVISKESKLRWLSPKHHWRTGKIKLDLEKNVRLLAEEDSNDTSIVLFGVDSSDDIEDLYEYTDQVVRVLNSL